MKIICIEWQDPCFWTDGWHNQEEFWKWAKQDNALSYTVGFLAYETESYLVLLQSIGETQVADSVKINRSAIKQVKEFGSIGIDLEANNALERTAEGDRDVFDSPVAAAAQL